MVDNLHKSGNELDLVEARTYTGLFGNSFIIDGSPISRFDPPPCVRAGRLLSELECQLCEYFSAKDCLLRNDNFLFDDVMRFFHSEVERKARKDRQRRIIVKVIYSELKGYGRSLHYSILFRMVSSRHPMIKIRLASFLGYIDKYPELFERVDEGVYKAKKR